MQNIFSSSANVSPRYGFIYKHKATQNEYVIINVSRKSRVKDTPYIEAQVGWLVGWLCVCGGRAGSEIDGLREKAISQSGGSGPDAVKASAGWKHRHF